MFIYLFKFCAIFYISLFLLMLRTVDSSRDHMLCISTFCNNVLNLFYRVAFSLLCTISIGAIDRGGSDISRFGYGEALYYES